MARRRGGLPRQSLMALPRNDVKKGIAVARVKRPLILAPAGARRGEGKMIRDALWILRDAQNDGFRGSESLRHYVYKTPNPH